MTIRNFEKLFRPKSLALIGAGNRPHSVGHVLMQNVLKSGFEGPIMPVNPKYDAVGGILAYPDIDSLPMTPDLAVLCIGAEHVPQTIADLGKRGTRAAVVISAGFLESGNPEGKVLEQEMLAAAKPYNMRIIGPNCLGIMVPGSNLNASFAHIAPAAGELAFVSQSGALCAAILDSVAGKDIGFSHYISLGNASDVDFGDMLDYLASDAGTSAILLYIESVNYVRKFMSAARAAARNKPVIVIKSGRNAAGAKAAASHTGALIGSDGVYDVAFRRAGMLRVYDLEELFDAVETLARLTGGQKHFDMAGSLANSLARDALAIVTNGGGPAVLATDYLVSKGGKLADLSAKTIEKLNTVLPVTWSHGNPVDIIGDADGKRYSGALEAVLSAPETDAVFVMNCPTAVSDNMESAQTVIDDYNVYKVSATGRPKVMMTCWLGEATAAAPRLAFAKAGIPSYETPEKAMRAFLHIAEYRHNQAVLMEVPPTVCDDFNRDKVKVQAIIANAIAQGRSELFENEAKEVLSAYSIPVVKTTTVSGVEEAVISAQAIGFPVAIKIVSSQISHKSDVGGVALNLTDADEVRSAAKTMLEKVKKIRPEAVIEGFTVQQMVSKPGGYELIIGVSSDRQFGPVIMFGAGGVAVEVMDDKVLGLPPLNSLLAEDMIRGTQIYKQLKGFRDRKPVQMDVIVNVLVQVSQLVTDVADISELDINPLLVDSEGGIALDGRIKLSLSAKHGSARLAISTYPEALEEKIVLKDNKEVFLRPVRPGDAASLKDMIERLTPDDLYQRFQGEFPVLSPDQAARLTHIDYDREMVLVGVPASEDIHCPASEMFGCLLCTMYPGNPVAEFTLVVRSDQKGLGLGIALTSKLVRYLKTLPAVSTLVGYALPGNNSIIDMVKKMGFLIEENPADSANKPMIKVSFALK